MTFSGMFPSQPVASDQVAATQEPGGMPEIEDEKEASVGDLINQLVSLCSYLDKLYMQSHLIHLNIEGPLFFPLHEFYKEQYTSLVEEFDTLAEFVRSMDYLMPMCERGLNAACPKFTHVKSYDAREMSTTYLKNLEQCGMMAKEAVETAREVEAPDVENALADTVKLCFKSSWMLKSTLRT
jgi:starvation-inducible DNA-binding protein